MSGFATDKGGIPPPLGIFAIENPRQFAPRGVGFVRTSADLSRKSGNCAAARHFLVGYRRRFSCDVSDLSGNKRICRGEVEGLLPLGSFWSQLGADSSYEVLDLSEHERICHGIARTARPRSLRQNSEPLQQNKMVHLVLFCCFAPRRSAFFQSGIRTDSSYGVLDLRVHGQICRKKVRHGQICTWTDYHFSI